MVILAIDTAGPDCAVAVLRSSEHLHDVLASSSERIGRGHAERLVPAIERALDDAGCSYDDLDRVAVTVGPGSVTGIRVGIAAARALALALEIEAVGVGVLDALAHSLRPDNREGTLVAALDAKRGEVYALGIDAASGGTVMDARAGTPVAIAGLLVRPAGRRPLILVGSGAALVDEALAACGIEAQIVGDAEVADILSVAELGSLAVATSSPRPLYLRGADAKVQIGKAVARQ